MHIQLTITLAPARGVAWPPSHARKIFRGPQSPAPHKNFPPYQIYDNGFVMLTWLSNIGLMFCVTLPFGVYVISLWPFSWSVGLTQGARTDETVPMTTLFCGPLRIQVYMGGNTRKELTGF